ncbi:MAG: folate-binding protein [Pseudomonadota bacterium]
MARPSFPPTRLARGVIRVEGPDANHLLDRIITCPMPSVGEATLGALLTPQGKILFEFILFTDETGFWVDLDAAMTADFLKRMTFYKLRADVTLSDRSETHAIIASPEEIDGAVISVADPRHPDLGWRSIVATETAPPIEDGGWHAHRVSLGIPEGGRDYAFSDAFPHDVGIDALGGVGFTKGCFVGQEVVSRMQHRGTARRRPVIVSASGEINSADSVTAAGKPIGSLGDVVDGKAIAILRIDRLEQAQAKGATPMVGETPVEVTTPDWATWMQAEETAEDAGETSASA